MAVFKDKNARPKADLSAKGEINALLGAGTNFEGKLNFEGIVRIDGSFKGEIISDDVLIVGEKATVEADVRVGAAVLMGTVRGNVVARDAIEIHASGRIFGQVTTPSIKIDEGALFEGQCNMQKKDGAATVTPISSASGTPGA